MDKQKTFEIEPHPELFLIDPITGELPKNYKEILKKMEDDRNKPPLVEEKYNIDFKAAFKNFHAEMEQARNEPLNIPGLSNSAQGAKKITGKVRIFTKDGHRVSKKLEIKSYNSRKSKDSPKFSSLPKSTPLTNPKVSSFRNPRKVLFVEQRGSKTVQQKKNSEKKIDIDDTLPLLDISEMENKLLPPKLPKQINQKTSTFIKPKSVLKKNSTNALDTSASSLEEFIKSEQDCKTPKKSIMGKTEPLEMILKKLDQLQSDMDKVKSDMDKVKSDMDKVKSDVSGIMKRLNVKSDETPQNKDIKSDSLRVQTLEKQFVQKRVLFNIKENNENEAPVDEAISKDLTVVRTPNTQMRYVKEKVEEQYLMMMTPRL